MFSLAPDDQAKGPLTVVMQKFFNQVDVSEDHSSATVPLELEFVEGLAAMQVSGKTNTMHNVRTPR